MDFALRQFAAHLVDLGRSRATIKRYVGVIEEFGEHLAHPPGGDGRTLDDVTKDHVVRFLRLRGGTDGAAATQNVSLASLRTFYEFLVRHGMATRNPTEEIAFLPVRPREPAFLTRREYDRLLRVVRRTTPSRLVPRNEAIVVTLYNTGLRVSELAALTLDMIDAGTKAFRNVPLKGGRYGSVEWNRETARVVEAWLATRKTWGVSRSVRALFVTEQGAPLSVRAIEDVFSRYSKALRLPKRVTPHVLRHSMATELLRQGHDIRVIADLLHHRSLNTTKRYTHLVDAQRREALASLEPGNARPPPRRRS